MTRLIYSYLFVGIIEKDICQLADGVKAYKIAREINIVYAIWFIHIFLVQKQQQKYKQNKFHPQFGR